ncbi:hypothetical protein [Kineosporia sp. NBRC 101731]|uniref:hypothetical protein n=1 Tax=Kineosporia sp. NBRC 101731 TaxID=3032199 RepID=UPI0024A37807|nr:hypothetical protein [Kineosporia sp. NBRC 101731]GLY29101.1 hypothetical protein Kisp02_24660 [Kineosporia sp. NBRC 101731]
MLDPEALSQFLADDEHYQAAERMWWDWLVVQLREVPGRPEWVSWNVVPGQGTVDDDEAGNPVLSARATDFSRALRMIQHAPEPENTDVVFASWVTRCPPDFEELPREELVVSLIASAVAVERAERLVRAWLSGADRDKLQEINPDHEE